MEYVIKNREPADVLRYFEEISAIPRGSGNEKAIGEYLLDFAAKLGLEARMDDLYNVVIKKPASPGCEHLDPVILQGHTDMVCEKNKNVEHDFTKDGIKLVVDGDILRADGTTLGADNGQAVACMMAFLARKDMKHPPLECVFTSQEEVGLIGAIGFDPYDLKGTRMINMDCGPEGVCVAGSAGGTTIDIYKTVKRVPFAGEAVSLKVRGLKGGHSGSDIDKERGNANKIAARVLYAIAKEMKVNLVSMDGGMMMNAIPRECDAVAAVADAAKAAEIAAEVEKKVKSELEFSDPGLTITLEPAAAPAEMICDEDSDAFLKMLYLMPAGLVAKSMALEGLTVASQNLAAVKTQEDGRLYILYSLRSSVNSFLDDMGEKIDLLCHVFGAEAIFRPGFPTWEYTAKSELRDMLAKAYKELTGKEMKVEATHGGLEGGAFLSKMPGLDIAAIGCGATGAHTPQEQLDLNSYKRMVDLVARVLEMMCE